MKAVEDVAGLVGRQWTVSICVLGIIIPSFLELVMSVHLSGYLFFRLGVAWLIVSWQSAADEEFGLGLGGAKKCQLGN